MDTSALGGGLIAAGALLLLATLLFPPAAAEWAGGPDRDRQVRNRNIATLLSGVVTLIGAAIALAGTAWIWPLVGASVAVAAYYLALVYGTHRDRRDALAAVLHDRRVDHTEDGRPGRVLMSTAARVDLLAGLDLIEHPVFVNSDGYADLIQARAERQARLTWAFRYPYGVERSLLWRVQRRRRRQARD